MVCSNNTAPTTEREANWDAALRAFKTAAREYDPTILSLLVLRAGENLDRVDAITFNRSERYEQAMNEAEGGAS